MRELRVTVPVESRGHVVEIAHEQKALSIVSLDGQRNGEAVALVVMHLRNRQIGDVLDALGEMDGVNISLDSGTMTGLLPDDDGLPDHLIDVQPRSPLEVYLSGLQSIGTWPGYLGYAAAAGIVAWIALYTNSVLLLLAAILIAPFASPAMNVALASAGGDTHLLWRSLLRYAAGLAVAIAVSAGLSLLFGLSRPSNYMEDVIEISSVAFLLPIVTGAAGAASLVKSERSNLIPGTAVGALLAASLAPPAVVAGVAISLGLWNMLDNSVFLLLLQLAGINLGGMIVFRLNGLNPKGARLKRRRKGVFEVVLLATLVGLAALLAWQSADPPELQRVTRAQRMNNQVGVLLDQHPQVELVRSEVDFARADRDGRALALVTAYVERRPGVTEERESEELRETLVQELQAQLMEQAGYPVVPLVNVVVLDPPPQSAFPPAVP